MEIGNNKIRLKLANYLPFIQDVFKGAITSDNFQVSLGDDLFSNKFRLTEVTNENELARIDLIYLECKIENEVNLWELKIKVPVWCAEKIKEIGLYYRESPKESGILIASWHQSHARLSRQEELVLQLVVPNKQLNQTSTKNDLDHSRTTQGLANFSRTVHAEETSSKQCIVRNLEDVCLLALPDRMGAHSNGWGNFNIKVIDSDDERTVISVTSLYYTGYDPVKFTIPKGFNLVVSNWWWNYWKIQKDLYLEKQEKLNDTNKNLEKEKDRKIKELQEQLDHEKNKKIKELQDKIKYIIEDPIRDKNESKLELHKNANKAIEDLQNKIKEQEDILKDMEGGNKDLENNLEMLKKAIKEINNKRNEDIEAINNEDLVDRIASLHKQMDELEKKLNKEKINQLKQLEDKLNNENQKKIKDLEEKLTKTIKELKKQNNKVEDETKIPDKINETKEPKIGIKVPDKSCDEEAYESCECNSVFIINCCCC